MTEALNRFTRVLVLFPTDDVESEKWYLCTDFPSATIKTEPITDEPPPGLVPSVTLTITAISTPLEKVEPPLEMSTGVCSNFHPYKQTGSENIDLYSPISHLIFLEPVAAVYV